MCVAFDLKVQYCTQYPSEQSNNILHECECTPCLGPHTRHTPAPYTKNPNSKLIYYTALNCWARFFFSFIFFFLSFYDSTCSTRIHITSAVHHVCYNRIFNVWQQAACAARVNDINVIKEEQMCVCARARAFVFLSCSFNFLNFSLCENYAAFTTHLIKLFQSATTTTATDYKQHIFNQKYNFEAKQKRKKKKKIQFYSLRVRWTYIYHSTKNIIRKTIWREWARRRMSKNEKCLLLSGTIEKRVLFVHIVGCFFFFSVGLFNRSTRSIRLIRKSTLLIYYNRALCLQNYY